MLRFGSAGEELTIRRHLAMSFGNPSDQALRGNTPLKGGGKAERTAMGRMTDEKAFVTEGAQPVFFLSQRGADPRQIPIVAAGETGEQDALLVFSHREKAKLYLQVADLEEEYEPVEVSPMVLGPWLRQCEKEGVHVAGVNLNRQKQSHGEPQPALMLSDVVDRADENLYVEIQALARG